MSDGAAVIDRLRALPGGPELLELARERDDVELVGGAVRDLLLGREPRELDVVVAGAGESFATAAADFAAALAARLGAPGGEPAEGGDDGAGERGEGGDDSVGERVEHERFGTAIVASGPVRVDIATRRAESYAAPGALPEVRAGTPEEDLLRRDFTVNAIALALGAARRGELREAPGALADLAAARLRVLHARSFLDDPTRILRLARYRARLGFDVEEHTAELLRAALAADALRTVSGARVGAELRLALGELDAPAALVAWSELGVLAAIHPRLRYEETVVRTALDLLPHDSRPDLLPHDRRLDLPPRDGPPDLLPHDRRADLLPRDGRPDLLLLTALALPLVLHADGPTGAELQGLLRRLEFPAADRERVLAAALAVPALMQRLPLAANDADLHALAEAVPVEGVALAGALSVAAHAAAARWLDEIRHVRLQITGDDLLAAGVPQGPEIGQRLRETLVLRLRGDLDPGRDAELDAALGLPLGGDAGIAGERA